jgi:hypothetical protein
MLYSEFGCDAVLCRAGTFNIHGHATLHSACTKCPSTEDDESSDPPVSTILGRVSCDTVDYLHGDLNGDGILSHREILRMIYVDTLGRFWGSDFQKWANMKHHECDLEGVSCVKGVIVKIDLTNANLCSDGNRKSGPTSYCKGLPAEIGELSSLEVLQLSRRQFLRGMCEFKLGLLKFVCLLWRGEVVSSTFSACLSQARYQPKLADFPTCATLTFQAAYRCRAHCRPNSANSLNCVC